MGTRNSVVAGSSASNSEASMQVLAGNPFGEMARTGERRMRHTRLGPFGPDWPLAGAAAESVGLRLPAVDVIEQDGSIIVRAELPGVDRKDVELSVRDASLKIEARARAGAKAGEGGHERRETSRSDFARTLALPGKVAAEQFSAGLQDGVLEVVSERAGGPRQRNIVVE